jgi:hypothetical protein
VGNHEPNPGVLILRYSELMILAMVLFLWIYL